MIWLAVNRAVDALAKLPHVATCFLGCGFIRGWLDILILAARATPSPLPWMPAGVHIIMCLVEAACFLAAGWLARRRFALYRSDIALLGCVLLPLVGGMFMVAPGIDGQTSDMLITTGVSICGAGYALHLLVWLEAYGRMNTRLAVLAWAGSSVVSFLVWGLLEPSGMMRTVLLFALPILSLALIVVSFRHLDHETGEGSWPASGSQPLGVPWLLILWVATFALLYGLADGRTGTAFSTMPSRVGMTIPSVVVMVGVMLCAGRFDFKTLTVMALGCMAAGLLVVFVIDGSHAVSQVLISTANESYLMFAHMFACSLAYRLKRSAAELCGLVGAVNIVSINVGMIAGSGIAPWLDGAKLAGVLVGVGAVSLILMVTVAAVYSRDYLDSFTLRPDSADVAETILIARAESYGLSPKETAVFRLLARGLSAPEIAEELFCASGTVRAHTSNIYRKMGVHARAEFEEALRRCSL